MDYVGVIAFAVLGGIGPALLWLWFWLRQDKADPEPKRRILYTFLAGMVIVILVYPFEEALYEIYAGSLVALFLSWAAIEEFFKLGASYAAALTSKAMDEPIDAIIYFITAALGFAALENTVFLIQPLMQGDLAQTFITGNLRFIGASLLHVGASAMIGAGVALSYYRSRTVRIVYTFIGIILSVALHGAFNLFIMHSKPEHLLFVFSFVWIAIVALIFIFQRVKQIKREHYNLATR